jgi:hypothetical protein
VARDRRRQRPTVGRLLDVDAGVQPYRALFQPASTPAWKSTVRAPALGVADAYYDGHRFPFDDACFDRCLQSGSRTCLRSPEFSRDASRDRARAPGCCSRVPFVWDEHEQPWDYARYSSFVFARYSNGMGFRVLRQRKLLADGSVLFQLANCLSLFKVCRRRSRTSRWLVTLRCWFGPSLCRPDRWRTAAEKRSLFLDQLVVARDRP